MLVKLREHNAVYGYFYTVVLPVRYLSDVAKEGPGLQYQGRHGWCAEWKMLMPLGGGVILHVH